ncbi:MAG: LL-diaminopimelate aminotransferase [Cellulomonadaceae bacterium]|jgi:LL-diaminopimelate aminotransferase|nr:LL-diaminopimelate aminotransferase [Cellulomonadaceae bacterium]
MLDINQNFLKLPGNYLFSTIAQKVAEFSAAHPQQTLLRLGIGDVTQPLVPAVIDALHAAVTEMGDAATFHGYPPDQGYEFLRSAMAEHDFASRGCDISADEVFISDGAKSDSGNLQEIFGPTARIAVCDPVYPVYVDSNAMAGRAGTFNENTGTWTDLIYLPCRAATGFAPELPTVTPDVIYLCFPNNPTGATVTRDELQRWVDYANRLGAVIVYDAAYEAFITEADVPHSIFECDGARTCAIELRSFSKTAGFTGLRLGATIIPRDLTRGGVTLHSLWARRQGTKFNGAPYIVQRAGEAVYSEAGRQQTAAQVAYYLDNATMIREGMSGLGYEVFGGINAPYVWVTAPAGMTSWAFFNHLLENAGVVSTPGSGFGPHGEGYLRLTAFGARESTEEAMTRIANV